MKQYSVNSKLSETREIFVAIGLATYASVERNLLVFVAMVQLPPDHEWTDVAPEPIGTSTIINFIAEHYGIQYAPNTRETIRKDSLKPLERLGIITRNAQDPTRPTNSPHTDYQLDPHLVQTIRAFGTDKWAAFAQRYRSRLPQLEQRQIERKVSIPVQLPGGGSLALSPGAHSQLIKAIIESFTHHFTPQGAAVAYIGDTSDNLTLADNDLLRELGIDITAAAEKPDVVLWYANRSWLIYLEAVHSSGHFTDARKQCLRLLSTKHHPIFISCFRSRRQMAKALASIATQTEVWIADEPSHLIHFDGERFLGPYH